MSSKSKKSRPPSTAAISVPQVYDSSSNSTITSFSPNADLFALLSLAVDKHRLRVFDTTTSSVVAEHIVDNARVTCLEWALLDFSTEAIQPQQSHKRRKKTTVLVPHVPRSLAQIIILGLSNGTQLLFSPVHARVLRTLSHPSTFTAILAICTNSGPNHIWSSSADGTVCLWNASRNELLSSWNSGSGVPYSALAPRPSESSDTEMDLLVANHAIHMLSFFAPTMSTPDPVEPIQRLSFTGHTTAVSSLRWDTAQPSRFISTAEADRFVNIWSIPDGTATEGVMLASAPLDASVRYATLSPTAAANILTISTSGKVALFKLSSSTETKGKVATLSPRSIIAAPLNKGDDDVQVVAATYVPQNRDSIRVARLCGGAVPVFEDVRYLNDVGEFISEVTLSKNASPGLALDRYEGPSTLQKRYKEAPGLDVRSGLELGTDAAIDDIRTRDIDGDLDVDLAELSLGQRRTALTGVLDVTRDSGSSADEAASSAKASRRRKKPRTGKEDDADHLPIPAQSLSRTLVQALHSGDSRLLETCLIHSDERLVLNTVRRLPPQLAVPLLNACVERLGRGARSGTGKGGGGGASAQRGMGLIRWIRAVLVVHTAHLMTIPDIVARLSGLHATLTARLALRDRLLSLNGRLELVLSQIEIRSSVGPAPIVPEGQAAGRKSRKGVPVKYVEGESESDNEDEDEDDVMVVEKGADAESIEDVELDGESGSDEDYEGGASEDDEGSEEVESDEGPRLNGFIDDEAEEWIEEEDGDSDE